MKAILEKIDVDGRISVDDLLRSLGLDILPEGCGHLALDDQLEVAVTADREALKEEFREEIEEDFEGVFVIDDVDDFIDDVDDFIDAIKALLDQDLSMALTLLGRAINDSGANAAPKRRIEDLIFAYRRRSEAPTAEQPLAHAA